MWPAEVLRRVFSFLRGKRHFFLIWRDPSAPIPQDEVSPPSAPKRLKPLPRLNSIERASNSSCGRECFRDNDLWKITKSEVLHQMAYWRGDNNLVPRRGKGLPRLPKLTGQRGAYRNNRIQMRCSRFLVLSPCNRLFDEVSMQPPRVVLLVQNRP